MSRPFWTGRFQVIVTGRRDTQILCRGCARWLPIIGAIADRDVPYTFYHEACVPQDMSDAWRDEGGGG